MPGTIKPKTPRKKQPRAREAAPPPHDHELLTDLEARALLRLGEQAFAAVQRRADFPAPIWLGARSKRHVRSRLMTWALGQTASMSEHSVQPKRGRAKAAEQASADRSR